MSALTESAAWRALGAHAEAVGRRHLRDWFAADPGRDRRCCLEAAGLFVDWSRHRADHRTIELLLALAQERALDTWTRRLFDGEAVNGTERRAALHTALRARAHTGDAAAASAAIDQATRIREAACAFAHAVRDGRVRGHRGAAFTDVVNLGIGGSDLGPTLVASALAGEDDPGPCMHPVSGLDPRELRETLRALDPGRTLVVVSSKSFGTLETLANARLARQWVVGALGEEAVQEHFAAATGNAAAALAFGIAPGRIFDVPAWVGGRYSLWSAVGLPAMIALGPSRFDRLLAGARAMDRHFAEASPGHNLPLLLGLLGLWCTNFLGAGCHAVLPYDYRLRELPAHLQLEMESNGKSVDRHGAPLTARTPVTWGGVGTSVQHAFFQALHQGVGMPPTEFVGFSQPARVVADDPVARDAHDTLVSNMFAQSRALAFGSHLVGSATDPQRTMPGNRPSTTLLVSRCSPEALGALLALYEHATFVRGVLWGVNSFDQWGVELGKSIAKDVAASFVEGDAGALDSSSALLVDTHRRWRTSS